MGFVIFDWVMDNSDYSISGVSQGMNFSYIKDCQTSFPTNLSGLTDKSESLS